MPGGAVPEGMIFYGVSGEFRQEMEKEVDNIGRPFVERWQGKGQGVQAEV